MGMMNGWNHDVYNADNSVCFGCQRNMFKVNDTRGDLFFCRYCGFITYALRHEHTSFVVSWRDEDKVETVKNVPVMYWEPFAKEETGT